MVGSGPFSISGKRPAKLPANHSVKTYPTSKTPFMFVLLVRQEGTDLPSISADDGGDGEF